MIRVVLPAHLRKLAHVSGEVRLEVDGPVTQTSVLDALEARYPMLRGTIREHDTKQRRPLVRFFACTEDLLAIVRCSGGHFVRDENCKRGTRCVAEPGSTRCAKPDKT